MKAYFSRRHANSISGLPLSFRQRLRHSFVRNLRRFSQYGGWDNDDNHTFERAAEALRTFCGTPGLTIKEGDTRLPADFDQLIERGYPSEVLDGIEAWFDQAPPKAADCERELNDCLSMNLSPWRFVNGEAVLVNSEYLHEEVQARTLRLLQEGRAFGALEEFRGAIQDLQSGEHKDAVVKAHKSVESVMKIALEIEEHRTFGRLLSDLITSGIIPGYYEDFLHHFEKLMLGSCERA